jgi:hypothetical protein
MKRSIIGAVGSVMMLVVKNYCFKDGKGQWCHLGEVCFGSEFFSEIAFVSNANLLLLSYKPWMFTKLWDQHMGWPFKSSIIYLKLQLSV